MEKRTRLDSFDGIKGICACVIAFVWHYQHFAPEVYPFSSVLKLFYDCGLYAVEIFFVLSGFGMMIGYGEKIGNGKVTFAQYILKRIRKIYPLMIITTVVVAVLQYFYLQKAGCIFQYPTENYNVFYFVLNLLGLQNGIINMNFSFNAPTWFISVLMVCYVVFYGVVKLCRSSRGLLSAVSAAVIAAGLVPVYLNLTLPVINFHIGRGLAAFFMGVLLAIFYKSELNISRPVIGYVSLVILAAAVVVALTAGYGYFGNPAAFCILVIAPLIVLASVYVTYVYRLLSLPPLRYLGRISMYIFMWHFPIQIVWKLIPLYTDISIGFGGRKVWVLYALSVLLFAALYERVAGRRVS